MHTKYGRNKFVACQKHKIFHFLAASAHMISKYSSSTNCCRNVTIDEGISEHIVYTPKYFSYFQFSDQQDMGLKINHVKPHVGIHCQRRNSFRWLRPPSRPLPISTPSLPDSLTAPLSQLLFLIDLAFLCTINIECPFFRMGLRLIMDTWRIYFHNVIISSE